MSGWRVGVAIKPEQEFGVEDTSADWHYIGVGLDMTINENNNWRFVHGMGSKTPQLEYEGRFTATWSGNLYLDYNNFYWLLYGLEQYSFKKIDNDTRGLHIFSTANNKTLKSFSMRFLKLNREVGGPYDENKVLLGCTMNKVSPNYESSSSAVKCSVGGTYVNTILTAQELDDTFIPSDTVGKKKVQPINWGCLQILNDKGTDWMKVANNERTGFSFNRTITTYPDCGERIDSAYSESAVQPISIGCQVYSRNPNQWQTRMHTGGVANNLEVGQSSSPRRKNLESIPDVRIASGSDEGHSCIAQFDDAIVDSWGNSYTTSSQINESPSIRAKKGFIAFKTPDVLDAIATSDDVSTVTYTFENTEDADDLVMYYPVGYSIRLIDYKGTQTGYTFKGWSSGSTQYKVGEEVMLTGDMTFTAVWESTESS